MFRSLSFLASLLLVAAVAAQAQAVFTLTADQLQNGRAVELDKLNWKFQPGDDPRFANPQFDDRAWATLADSAKPEDSPSGWRGIGWFRLRLRVAPELANVPLNLEMAHLGASEVYLNGKLLRRFGVVGNTRAEEAGFNPNALPLGIVLQAGAEQVIAVRYSNQQAADVNSWLALWVRRFGETYSGISGIGFHSRLREFGDILSRSGAGYGGRTYTLSYIAAETFAYFSFGILYLLLFAFFARQRSNLFFGLSLLSFGLNDLVFTTILTAHYGFTEWYLLWWGLTLTWFPAILALMAFVYSAFTPGVPRRMWLFVAGILFVAFWEHVWPVKNWSPVSTLCTFTMVLEMLRVMSGAIRQRLPGARYVAAGILFLSLNLLQGTLVTPFLPFAVGSFGMILALSLYLARDYARTNKHLEEQLVQVKQLSAAALEHEKVKAESERRAKELEEARQLQLSMLPKKLPALPQLDIAAYMKTASEVGGDYYDFHLGEDGTLTVAVGDATGHGLKAGTLVASVKSLFVSLADHPDITHVFARMSRVLKEMKLRGLFMAMTVAKVRGDQLRVSIAGMPPVLICRAPTGAVEEIAIRALPLGGLANYQYRQQELTLAAGDVIVLMSDGLPERFNAEGEMLDDMRIHQTLAVIAHQPSEQIINELVRLGDEWGAGRPQDDDITFVVLKLRSGQER
jgi:serine phosphatase RsbU (regulator of sigma subunit)